MSANTEPEKPVTDTKPAKDTGPAEGVKPATDTKAKAADTKAKAADTKAKAADTAEAKDAGAGDKVDKAAKAKEKAGKPPKPVKDPAAKAAAAAKRAKLLPFVLAGLCVALAVVVGLLGWWAISDSNTHKADEAALEAARTKAPLVLSYAPATVDKDIETARAQLSGLFAEQFDQLVNQVVLPATKQQGLSSKCVATHSALMDAPSVQPDVRDVLVFMQQEVSGANQPQPQKGIIQVKVTVTKTPEGEWKVSNLQPI